MLNQRDYTKSTESIYFPELDGLRFLAFLLVFVHHHSPYVNIPFLSIIPTNGWIGVDLFFVLSAFLFTKLLIAEHDKTKTISFKKFYMRRIFRIWPVYFLFIGFSMAYFFMTGLIEDIIPIRIIGLFTFSDNILTALYGYNGMSFLNHLWTIAYEEQFYIFIPIIILLLVRSSAKTKLITFISVLILFNAIRIYFILNQVPHPAIWVLPITHFESIVLGVAIGFGGGHALLKWFKPLWIGVIGVISFVLLSYLPSIAEISYRLILSYSLVGISTALVLISVLNSNHLKKLFSKEVFVFLGKRSYGLYLYHLLGKEVASYLIIKNSFLPANNLSFFMTSFSFTIAVSIISYSVVETPFLKWKRKFEVITSRPI